MLVKIPLGSTGLAVSRIGLGTVKFGRNQKIKYPKRFALPSDSEMSALLYFAKEQGINLIDTAPAYGTSEERLGHWFDESKSRADWVLVSKFGEQFQNGVSAFDFSKKAAIKSIEQSLRRLHTDYLDVLLVHSDGNDKEIIEKYQVFDTLQALKNTGKIRAFGMSTKTLEGGLLTIEYADLAMVTYNLLEQNDYPIITLAHQLQKGILIKKALASGHITENVSNGIQKSIEFILKESGVSSIIVGTLNALHLKEIIGYAKQF